MSNSLQVCEAHGHDFSEMEIFVPFVTMSSLPPALAAQFGVGPPPFEGAAFPGYEGRPICTQTCCRCQIHTHIIIGWLCDDCELAVFEVSCPCCGRYKR